MFSMVLLRCVMWTPSTNDFGITMDENLSCSLHISIIVKEALARASIIFNCFRSRNINALPKALTVNVSPLVLEYCTPIWNPHSSTNIGLISSAMIRKAADAVIQLSITDSRTTNACPLLGRRCYIMGGLLPSLCLSVCLPRCVLWPNGAR